MKARPNTRTTLYPNLGTSTPEKATPTVDARNCAAKSSPACASFKDQRAASDGSTGPSSTVMIPVGTKAIWATAAGVRNGRRATSVSPEFIVEDRPPRVEAGDLK